MLVAGCTAGPGRPAAPREAIVAARVEPPAITRELHVSCADRDACPDGVGLLVRPTDPEAQRCTAVLVAPDRALTASHCLAPSSRHAGAACDDAWIAFPSSGGEPAEWVGCERVIEAHDVTDEAVLRPDVALLLLRRALTRTTYPIDPRPPEPGSIVSVIAVRPNPIYPHYHELSQRLCRVATRESAVETFGDEAARVGWLMDCPSYPGNSGSPVLDARGRVRSLLHGGSAAHHAIGITSTVD